MKYYNPIIAGFHPDPSICRVEDDFYLVTSTFEFFPGVPIYHSKNLVDWEPVGHCLTRESQLPLRGCSPSGGIYAPTLRYHDGVFFMVTTNVSNGGNFIVHTTDIRGPWSEPARVKQGGYDPSLFWDDDGTCYFVSVKWIDGQPRHLLCEVNAFTGEMLTESVPISRGCGGKSSEGPHIYKINGLYYLLMAEGGTEYGHMVKILRSKDIYGPYEECPRNPILTHREEGTPDSDTIQGVGHGDLFRDQHGNWWMVCLGFRPIDGSFHNLGRETFLSPVVWDKDGWPVVGDNGRLKPIMEGPLPGSNASLVSPASYSFSDHFDDEKRNLRWNFVRNPRPEDYEIKNSRVILHGSDVSLSTPRGNPTLLAVRQQAFENRVTAEMEGEISFGQASGITVFYHQSAHYDLLVCREEDGYYVNLRRHILDINVVTERHKIDYNGKIRLRIDTAKDVYSFYYERDGQWLLLGTGLVAGLCKEAIYPMTFTGCYFGMFSERGTIAFDAFTVDVKDEPPAL